MSARDRQLLSRVVRDFRRRRRAPLRAMAPVLRVHPSTVSRWSRERGPRRLLGRPRRRVDLCVCCQVLAKVCSKAGRITVRALKRLFPSASKSWLNDVLRRDHQRRADRRRQWRFELEWTWPGTVWAMDFTSLGGRGSDRALCVRDLASCKVLYAAVVGPTAARETYQAVARLFAEHGAPLVLKADNESPFRTERLRRLLGRNGVLPLYSPRGTPPYNGSCEAGMAGLKRVALDLQIDDVLPEPLGHYLPRSATILGEQPITRRSGAPTRDQVWSQRDRCTPELREELRARYAAHELRYRRARGIAPRVPLTHADQASIDRRAIRDALCEMNLLVIRKA